MFGNIAGMMGNYDDRKVDRYDDEQTGLMVSTVMVTDSDQPYETAVRHQRYNDNKMVIVEMYESKEEAQTGHDKWVKTMTSKKMPTQLEDVSTSCISKMCDAVSSNEGWRVMEKG